MPDDRCRGHGAFSLIELLVVLGVISLLISISLPVLSKARCHAEALLSVGNQRQIVTAVNFFANDNDGRYPASVATIGTRDNWHWQEPTMLTAYCKRSPSARRSISAYLREYIPDASVMRCPSAPRGHKYFQQAWDAGDQWDHPKTAPIPDPLFGTYCFYWNYKGCLVDSESVFVGPVGPAWGRRQSRLLVTCYLGYDHWRSRGAFGSCERFQAAQLTDGSDVSSAYWSLPTHCYKTRLKTLTITPHAGYVDGHVKSFSPRDVAAMKVAITDDGTKPYPDATGYGIFLLPMNQGD